MLDCAPTPQGYKQPIYLLGHLSENLDANKSVIVDKTDRQLFLIFVCGFGSRAAHPVSIHTRPNNFLPRIILIQLRDQDASHGFSLVFNPKCTPRLIFPYSIAILGHVLYKMLLWRCGPPYCLIDTPQLATTNKEQQHTLHNPFVSCSSKWIKNQDESLKGSYLGTDSLLADLGCTDPGLCLAPREAARD